MNAVWYVAATDSVGWFPDAASTSAGSVDRLFFFILAICLIFFVLIVALMTYCVIRFRRTTSAPSGLTRNHNLALETLWSVIPAILVGVIFTWGMIAYLDLRQAPANSYEIQVVAKKWAWSFRYPNGYEDADLHVPVDRPVQLVMSSQDVIHSLFIPAFRVKMDVVPGRYNKTWFEANRPGTFKLFCTEYCGTLHSTMLARVVVHESGEFEQWLAGAAKALEDLSPVELGQRLYERKGCAQCHSVDGGARVGPTFYQLFGSQQAMTDGSTVTVDENYLRESILEPQAKVRAGYRPVMPTYQGQLDEDEIAALIAYIKSLE